MIINDLFLGVGAMKAGTTWITNHLKTHPDIYFTYEKELGYFAYLHDEMSKFTLSDDFRIRKIKNYVEREVGDISNLRNLLYWSVNYLRDPIDDFWYLNNFVLKGNKKYCADFSNLYAHLDDIGWNHVKSITKNLKVIYIIREPLDRLWSHIRFQLMLDGRIEEAKKWDKREFYEFGKQEHIWRNSRYSKIIRTLKKNLNNNQLLILFFEDIKSNPQKLLNKIEKFLNVEERKYDIKQLTKKVNPSKGLQKPEFFDRLFRDELYNEIKELETLGINYKNKWNNFN